MYSFKQEGAVNSFVEQVRTKGMYGILWSWNVTEYGDNLLGWSRCLVTPCNSPLWFLRDLIVVTLLSPILYYLIKLSKGYGVLAIGLAYFLQIWTWVPGFSITVLFFFSWGAYYGINKESFVLAFQRVRQVGIVTIVAAAIMVVGQGSQCSEYVGRLYVITGIVTVINIVSGRLNRRQLVVNQLLSKASFFIYASHMVIILPLLYALSNHVLNTTAVSSSLVQYFLVPFLTISMCLLFYSLGQRFMPRLLMVLTGNR